jgi:hypothetical protein
MARVSPKAMPIKVNIGIFYGGYLCFGASTEYFWVLVFECKSAHIQTVSGEHMRVYLLNPMCSVMHAFSL